MMRDVVRRLAPRALRNILRRPPVTLRAAHHEVLNRLGVVRVCPVREDWRLRCHPATAYELDGLRRQPVFQEELAGFARHCRPGMVLLDAGAHHGVFSAAALHFGGPDARVVSVEPSGRAARVLRINLALQPDGRRRSAVVTAALGERDGELEMLTAGPAGGDYMVLPREPRPDTRSVSLRSVDGVIGDSGLQPTHIKIDVEGYEAEVVRGARAYLAAQRPVVFLELHGEMLRERGLDPLDVLRTLGAHGYTFQLAARPIDPAQAAASRLVRLVCLPD